MTGYKNSFDLKELKIKMGLELFQKVPAVVIETLFDEQNQPLFKRVDLGKSHRRYKKLYQRLFITLYPPQVGPEEGGFDPLPWEDKKPS